MDHHSIARFISAPKKLKTSQQAALTGAAQVGMLRYVGALAELAGRVIALVEADFVGDVGDVLSAARYSSIV